MKMTKTPFLSQSEPFLEVLCGILSATPLPGSGLKSVSRWSVGGEDVQSVSSARFVTSPLTHPRRMSTKSENLDVAGRAYLAGLLDSEGHIGMRCGKCQDRGYKFGIHFEPVVQITLSMRDGEVLRLYNEKTGLGRLSRNERRGIVWAIQSKQEIRALFEMVNPYIKMPTTKRKIQLLEEFLAILPTWARLDKDKLAHVGKIIDEIHRLAKKWKGRNYTFNGELAI